MSYSRKSCRTYFSQDQFDLMEFYQNKFRAGLACQAATGLETREFLTGLNLYPNPASDKINIEFELLRNSPLTMEVVDIYGQLIQQEKFSLTQNSFRYELKVDTWGAGIYYLRFVQESQQQVLKWMKI